MANARQIVLQLRTDVLFKRRIHPVYITGKHRILPDNQVKGGRRHHRTSRRDSSRRPIRESS